MSWSRLSRLLLFLICSFWATAGAHAFSIGGSAGGTATISAGQGFGPKLQYGGGLTLDFYFPLTASWAGIETSVVAFTVQPSDISGDFLYRGYSGGAVTVMSVFTGTIAASPRLGEIRGGVRAGIGAALPSYWYTTLAFFYLEPRVEGLATWTPAALPQFTFALALPVAMQLRRDLDYSVSTGLSIGVLYTVGKVSQRQ